MSKPVKKEWSSTKAWWTLIIGPARWFYAWASPATGIVTKDGVGEVHFYTGRFSWAITRCEYVNPIGYAEYEVTYRQAINILQCDDYFEAMRIALGGQCGDTCPCRDLYDDADADEETEA